MSVLRSRLGGCAVAVVSLLVAAPAAWADPPTTTATPDRSADSNGWYNHPFTVTFAGTAGTPVSCSPPATTYSGPDTPSGTLSSTCTDQDIPVPDSATASFSFQYDATPPNVSGHPGRPPNSSGWYNRPVAVTFSGHDAMSGIASCTTAVYSGPDAAGAVVGGSCTDNAGNSRSATTSLNYDATPPTVTGAAAGRRPDSGRWYNHPVTFTFQGFDATSGIATCSRVTYAGPDSASASVTGYCLDNAGNGATFTVALSYKATPPLVHAKATAGDAYVVLHWLTSADTTRVKIIRKPGLRGRRSSVMHHGQNGSFRDTNVRDGVRYSYTVIAADQAGNVARSTVHIVPGPRLLSPAPGARLTAPPLLVWTRVRGASYYNVQLYRGTKLLSTWPAQAKLQLASSWLFRGGHYQLTPGVYYWYVWPGYGRRHPARYGKLIGRRSFVIAG